MTPRPPPPRYLRDARGLRNALPSVRDFGHINMERVKIPVKEKVHMKLNEEMNKFIFGQQFWIRRAKTRLT